MLGIPHIKDMIYENRKTYAEKHGLAFMWANMTSYNFPDGTPIYWNKIPILKEAFVRYPDAEWIWWMDTDIIIMNMSLSIYDHVLSSEGMARNILLNETMHGPGGGEIGHSTPLTYKHDDINFVISQDNWGMVVGNFLMRRGIWNAWAHMWKYHKKVKDHAVCMKKRSMDAYPEYNFLGDHWKPGDHVIHFAGCGGGSSCESEWNKYWNLREKVEVPVSVQAKLQSGTAEIENVQAGVGLPKDI
ncbi:hypothetical protein N7454_000506 [Penicillium verhagenii]|nr:hypothetical protein N7454_000506 [Penicillium verhagenii]